MRGHLAVAAAQFGVTITGQPVEGYISGRRVSASRGPNPVPATRRNGTQEIIRRGPFACRCSGMCSKTPRPGPVDVRSRVHG